MPSIKLEHFYFLLTLEHMFICWQIYDSEESNFSTCNYHPGIPVFHEGWGHLLSLFTNVLLAFSFRCFASIIFIFEVCFPSLPGMHDFHVRFIYKLLDDRRRTVLALNQTQRILSSHIHPKSFSRTLQIPAVTRSDCFFSSTWQVCFISSHPCNALNVVEFCAAFLAHWLNTTRDTDMTIFLCSL